MEPKDRLSKKVPEKSSEAQEETRDESIHDESTR